AVGIRKASIHHHFPTKEQLLDELIERYSRYFLSLVDDIIGSHAGPAAKLRRYASLFEATLSEGRQKKACFCGMLSAEVEALGGARRRGPAPVLSRERTTTDAHIGRRTAPGGF
ncbi:MAG: TetR/AcrR family transcriptional regulator, partial [Nitrospira sp.]